MSAISSFVWYMECSENLPEREALNIWEDGDIIVCLTWQFWVDCLK